MRFLDTIVVCDRIERPVFSRANANFRTDDDKMRVSKVAGPASRGFVTQNTTPQLNLQYKYDALDDK